MDMNCYTIIHAYKHNLILRRQSCNNTEVLSMGGSFHQSRSTWKCCQAIYWLVLSSFRHWATTGSCALKWTGHHLVKSISGKETQTQSWNYVCVCISLQFGNMIFWGGNNVYMCVHVSVFICWCNCACYPSLLSSSPPLLASPLYLFTLVPSNRVADQSVERAACQGSPLWQSNALGH